jgi:hypothetical protein
MGISSESEVSIACHTRTRLGAKPTLKASRGSNPGKGLDFSQQGMVAEWPVPFYLKPRSLG